MANDSVLRALQGLSGTLQRGFEARGDIALGGAEVGLKRAGLEHQIREDELMRPVKEKQVQEAQLWQAEQAKRSQPANMGYINTIFGADRMSPLNALHFASNVLPTLQKTSEWTTKQDGNLYKDDGSIVTQGDIDDNAEIMFGIYSTVTDTEKQMEDLAQRMKTNPRAPDVIEIMKDKEVQDAMAAKLNPNSDQTPYKNFLAKAIESKINTGAQIAAILKERGKDSTEIDKQVRRYENKLSAMATLEKERLGLQREESKERLTLGRKAEKEQFDFISDFIEAKVEAGEEQTPENISLWNAEGETTYNARKGNWKWRANKKTGQQAWITDRNEIVDIYGKPLLSTRPLTTKPVVAKKETISKKEITKPEKEKVYSRMMLIGKSAAEGKRDRELAKKEIIDIANKLGVGAEDIKTTGRLYKDVGSWLWGSYSSFINALTKGQEEARKTLPAYQRQ